MLYSLRIWSERLIFISATAFIVVLGGYQGLKTISFQLNIFAVVLEVVFIEAVASSMFLTLFMLISTLSLGWAIHKEKNLGKAEDQGKVTSIIPVYKDGNVLENSVESLRNTKYANKEIVVVCEDDDSESLNKAREIASDADNIQVLVNERGSSKAEAINYAVNHTESKYIALFDADQVIPEDFFSSLLAFFPENDAVATRKIPEPNGLIESIAYYESILFNYINVRLLYNLTDFRMLSNRGIVVKRGVIEDLGGFNSNVLTEDYEFSHRFYTEGFKGKELLKISCREQAAHTFKDWWGQRKRWMKGYLEVTAKTFLEAPKEIKNRRKIASLIISASTVLGGIALLTLISKFVILLLLDAKTIYLLPISIILLSILAVQIDDRFRHNISGNKITWILAPLIYPAFSIITLKALTELIIRSDNSWYRARKK